ncbi:hypothetical protein PGT21_026814 [Puccinia graminis f. sp. tritici]|uniref:Uncharacterized protein n=1 Tax=Puccinia graminis f. sp. tritici TaxID=56615 RepID=A0A5B0Q6W9_PUCGR|nr:hypothetical protein PGT21_026814 [Puccinia graminis f. sp. tritici]
MESDESGGGRMEDGFKLAGCPGSQRHWSQCYFTAKGGPGTSTNREANQDSEGINERSTTPGIEQTHHPFVINVTRHRENKAYLQSSCDRDLVCLTPGAAANQTHLISCMRMGEMF